jgi:hypothetical protein
MTFGRERENGPAVGRISETAVIKRLLELGYEVLLPYSSTSVYDLAYFNPPRKKLFGGMTGPGMIMLVQVKTAQIIENGKYLTFLTSRNTRTNGKRNKRRSYVEEVDEFMAYSPDTGKVYLVAMHEAPATRMILCLANGSRGPYKGTPLAKDYEL